MNEQLNKYVLDARASGLSDDEISKQLFVGGYQKEDVDAALRESVASGKPHHGAVSLSDQSPDTQNNMGKSKRRWLRTSLVTIFVLMLAIFVLWVAPFPRIAAPVLDHDKISKYVITRDVGSADLGISIINNGGNATDDFRSLVGQIAQPEIESFFWKAHNGQTVETAVLDASDKQALLNIVSNGQIRFELPENVFDIPNMVLPSIATTRQITSITIRTANDLANKGQYDEAKSWLHLIIALGRNLQDGSTSLLQWLAGVAIEQDAATALQEILLKEGNEDGAAVVLRSLKDLERQRVVLGEKRAMNFRLVRASAQFYQISFGVIPVGNLPAQVVYSKLGFSREKFLEELTVLNKVYDERYFGDDVVPLAILAQIPLEPERTLAREIINKYTTSSKVDIRNVAESALAATPEQVSQMLKQHSEPMIP